VKKTRLWSLSLMFIVSAISVGGCGRAHLSSQFAQAYVGWFSAQHVKAKPGTGAEAKRIIESLDAQEAAAVSKNYRKTVSRGGDEGVSRLLTIGAPRAGAESYMPAASSVPGN
jgi:hypothetical protein